MRSIKKPTLFAAFFFTVFSLLCLGSALANVEPIRVTSQTLAEVAIYPEFSVPATAISMNDSKLSAQVRATVTVFPVLVGDLVERGEVLIQLDERDYKLNLLRAQSVLKGIESRLSLANYQLDQAKSLSLQKAISNERLHQRTADVRSIEAERDTQKVVIAMAKRDLEKCTITAPFKAIVAERIAQTGELASPGSPLIRIIDASRIEVSAKIQSQDITSLKHAKHFQFVSQDKSYDVQRRIIIPVFDPVQRNREARFLFKKQRALSGATGTLRWTQSQKHIPANMLTRRNRKLGIFIINDENKAEFIVIKGAQEGRPAATNLSGDIRLITNGRFAIQDGVTVSVD